MNNNNTTPHWMASLAQHWVAMKAKYPQQKLAIVFDIDGTIIDSRHTIFYMLKQFDVLHNSNFFADTTLDSIDFYEGLITEKVPQHGLNEQEQAQFFEFYQNHRWSDEALLNSETAYPQVLELIQLMDTCEQTTIALNTGRTESLRRMTLNSLNNLAKEYGFQFEEKHLKMNAYGWEDVYQAKLEAMAAISKEHTIIAMLDNEPTNLNAMNHLSDDVLLMHADTIYGKPASLEARCVQGEEYCLTQFRQYL